MKVAYQGVPGAFSHEACLTFLADCEPFGKPTFANVIEAVEQGETEFGMLPYENSAVGPVEEVHRLLADCPLAIVARHVLPIRMHLLGLPGARLGDVTTAVSHPMALKQCAATAVLLADPTNAVLASEFASKAYGLTILKRDMQDHPDNSTIFVVLAKEGR